MTGHEKSTKTPENHALKLARFQLMAKAQLVHLGQAIKERRNELGLSQNELARKFPVDPKTVSRWERGENPGAYNNLEVVAEHLETTATDLQARAVAFGRDAPGGVPTQDEPSEALSLAEFQQTAARRHSEVMTELGKIRTLLEAQGTHGRQDAPRAARS